MSNKWIIFLKKYHAEHPNLSYKEAMQKAAPLYKKQSGGSKLRTMELKPNEILKHYRHKLPMIGKGKQRGGNNDIDLDALMKDLNINDLDLSNFDLPSSNPSMPSMSSMPSMPSVSNPRKEARDLRFMQRKYQRQFETLKKRMEKGKFPKMDDAKLWNYVTTNEMNLN